MLKIGKAVLGKTPQIVASFNRLPSEAMLRKSKKEGANIAELRVDLFSSAKPALLLKSIRALKALPLLLTIRSKVESGKWRFDEEKRLELFLTLLPVVDAVDIELSSRFILGLVVQAAKKKGIKVIVSFHDFEITPSPAQLLEILEKSLEVGADIVKIATRIRNPEDLRNLASFTAEHASKNLITIGMGEEGKMSRILFPALGSLLTYSYSGKATAPGQIDLPTMNHLVKRLYLQ